MKKNFKDMNILDLYRLDRKMTAIARNELSNSDKHKKENVKCITTSMKTH